MERFLGMCLFIGFIAIISAQSDTKKYKLCVVDGKGSFKKSQKYCPALDSVDSKVECVVAPDRTDCLRQVLKGKADFSVFTPEDLVTANNEGVQILVTNELRFGNVPHEYELVAVVDKKSGIKNRHNLKGKRYCHSGYGYESDWTKILSNFFEASVVTPSCDTKLTLFENRIKASSEFFGAACKAGPWANDPILDVQLKKKYPQLCSLCGSPEKCSIDDTYWGRRGALFCLTDGAGDISWARLDDVKPHFGLVPGSPEASADGYNFLCPDNSLMPLNSTIPCLWAVKPWPVVATRRAVADDIQKIVSTLSYNEQKSWRYDLLMLLETTYSTFYKLPEVEAIETYLNNAPGYLSANSFSGCHPPRTISVCTDSVIETAKCSWMRESASVYGVEPDLECIKADNKTHCMMAINLNIADVVIVPADQVNFAQKNYNLTTLFYETVADDEKYLTVAVTRPGSSISSFEDLRGKKACFPTYDGIAWNTVKNILFDNLLIEKCPLDNEMAQFFGPSCTPGAPQGDGLKSLRHLCDGDTFNGEFGALHCLTSEMGDVAFVSKNSIRKYVSNESEDNPGNSLEEKDFEIFCPNKSIPCHLSWAPIGQAMIRGNSTDLWKKDTLDVFLKLDELFGKNFKSLTNPFTMFGRFDGVSDLLFHDVTQKLRPVPYTKDNEVMPFVFDTSSNVDDKCIIQNKASNVNSVFVMVISMFLVHFIVRF